MIQRILLILITTFLLSGCKKSEEVKEAHTIKLFSEKSTDVDGTTIKADNKDEVILKCSIKDINGLEISADYTITLNGEKYTGGSFKTSTPGNYVFQASTGKILSNKYTITAVEGTNASPSKIELTSDRTQIMANGVQEAIFSCKVTDINGSVLPINCAFSVDNVPAENTFKTSKTGEYTVQASIGTLLSNKIIIKATDAPEGIPFKIILDSDRFLGAIKANNKDEATFKVKVTDITGKVLNDPYKLTLNGTPFSGSSFKTDKPGEYIFQAEIGSLTSNRYIVNAKEIADAYITLQGSSIESISSANLVSVAITFKNISNKTLKYVTFDVSCYNKANEIITETVKGGTVIGVQATGFFNPESVDTSRFEIGYFPGADHIKVTLRSVTLEDGTVITAG